MTYDGTLVMPSSYALMEEDEMMYLEGGKFYGVNLSSAKCASIASFLNVGSAASTFVGFFAVILAAAGVAMSAGLGAIAFAGIGVALTLSSSWFSKASKKGGCHIGYDSTKKKFSYGYGKY